MRMNRRSIAAAMSLIIGYGAVQVQAAQHDDPLLRPIAPENAAKWLGPQMPFRVFGQTYLVGFEGLNVALIKTGKGLILIDGAVPQAVPAIEANIRKLGFRISDVRYILSTEPHYDHAGGIAALARDSGATVLAGAGAIKALRSGQPDVEDPQSTILPSQPGIVRVRAVRDGERIRLGDTVVTAVATPGHTAGSTSWHWRACEAGSCQHIVFAASFTSVSAPSYRFSDHPALIAAFRRSFDRMRALPCGILLTSHPQQPETARGADRLRIARLPNPFIDAKACANYAGDRATALDERLKAERDRAAAPAG